MHAYIHTWLRAVNRLRYCFVMCMCWASRSPRSVRRCRDVLLFSTLLTLDNPTSSSCEWVSEWVSICSSFNAAVIIEAADKLSTHFNTESIISWISSLSFRDLLNTYSTATSLTNELLIRSRLGGKRARGRASSAPCPAAPSPRFHS